MRAMPTTRLDKPTARRRSWYLWLGVANAALAIASVIQALTGNRWWLVLAALWLLIAVAHLYWWRRPPRGRAKQWTGRDGVEG